MNTFKIALLLTMLLTYNYSHAQDCELLLRMHGFATRAQFQCGFNEYNQSIIEEARECNNHLSEARVKENLMKGMKMFDTETKKNGMKKTCKKALDNLPQVLRK